MNIEWIEITSFMIKDSIFHIYADKKYKNIEFETINKSNKEIEINRLKKIWNTCSSKFTDNFLNNAPMSIILKEIKKEDDIRNKLEILLGYK